MILPPRGASVDTNRRAELRELLDPQVVVQRIEKMVGLDQVQLTRIFSDNGNRSRAGLMFCRKLCGGRSCRSGWKERRGR